MCGGEAVMGESQAWAECGSTVDKKIESPCVSRDEEAEGLRGCGEFTQLPEGWVGGLPAPRLLSS